MLRKRITKKKVMVNQVKVTKSLVAMERERVKISITVMMMGIKMIVGRVVLHLHMKVPTKM